VTEAGPALPPACACEQQIAMMACMQTLGGETIFVDEEEDFAPGVVRLAWIGRLALERAGDRETSSSHRFTAYLTDESEPGRPFRLDPDRALFILSEQGFCAPSDWQLTLLHDPRHWYDASMLALWSALKPVLPAA
jgi:hypothetical protein